MHPRAHRQRHRMPAVPGHRRARPVGRQRQLRRSARQRLPPPGRLLGEQAAGVVLVTEQVPLPDRVVGVLHRQLVPARPAAGPPRRVRHRHIPRQRPRPTSRHRRCDGSPAPAHAPPGRRPAAAPAPAPQTARSNGARRDPRHRLRQLLLRRPRPTGSAQSSPARLQMTRWYGCPSLRREHRAQHLMPSRSGPPAPPPAPPRQAPPPAAPRPGCCTARSGPPAAR